jgi:hypothetical protein
MLPKLVFTLIQDNTPFFQEKVGYIHFDSGTKTSWLINYYKQRIHYNKIQQKGWVTLKKEFYSKYSHDLSMSKTKKYYGA